MKNPHPEEINTKHVGCERVTVIENVSLKLTFRRARKQKKSFWKLS
jgi:hypothetical protein